MNTSYHHTAEIAAKNFLQKYISRKKAPLPFNITDIADAETIDFNNDTNINHASSTKSAQIAAKKIVNKYKKFRKNKAPLPFNINDIADAETVDYNNDTYINGVLLSKRGQIAAKKIIKKYKNLRSKKKDHRLRR